MRFQLSFATTLIVLLASCQATSRSKPGAAESLDLPIAGDLPVAQPPYQQVEADWKQRIDQPYVYIEARGSYTGIGKLLERAFKAAVADGLEISGPPFALYYDDPGAVAVDELRMRACLPVESQPTPQAPLAFDVLPSTTVVYAFIGGPYPEVPRAYPSLFAFMRRLNWSESGPIREIYLRSPSSVGDWSELVTEVQIPAALAR